jgi:hypothetical protein
MHFVKASHRSQRVHCDASTVPVALIIAVLVLSPGRVCAADQSFEFVAEHLYEAAMDNRFATLPLWDVDTPSSESAQFGLQGAVARTVSSGLTLEGPMGSIALRRQMNSQWSMRAFGFLDELRFSGSSRQPLDTVFTKTPLALPAEASFTDLHGTYRNLGAGMGFNLQGGDGWLGKRQWVIGALYQRVALRDYQATYNVLEGPSSGATGVVDYSATYAFFTPFAGIATVRNFGAWSLAPHALLAIPLPRRGVQGRITGSGFDLSGDTATSGGGKHVGDISVTLGLDVAYKPWGLTFDLGTFVSQALLEQVAHKGIDQNWVISASKQF